MNGATTMDGDNTSNDDLAAFDAPRPDPLAAHSASSARACSSATWRK